MSVVGWARVAALALVVSSTLPRDGLGASAKKCGSICVEAACLEPWLKFQFAGWNATVIDVDVSNAAFNPNALEPKEPS